MVMGEDMSRWELYFQNLNILILQGVEEGDEGRDEKKSRGGGRSRIILSLGKNCNARDKP